MVYFFQVSAEIPILHEDELNSILAQPTAWDNTVDKVT